uniref:leucine-rich repeat and IQ domain-containing protein 1 n=1 Tax=Semicossyphus pulcher TaxID=241346 RepID=UPI0037E7B01F
MTHANEMYDTMMRELNNLVISDTDETKEGDESFSHHEESDSNEIPPSLLSYIESSKRRLAACEKLILEEPEDFTASCGTEDMVNLHAELDQDMLKLNEQVICDPETDENNTSTDTRLLPAPTEREALLTHNVSVCSNNEGEAEKDEYMESEKHLEFTARALEISLKAEREKRQCEEMKKKLHRRKIEHDFQEELKKIREAEELRREELELMQKKAQEKLEQELLLRQEEIRKLQRRVEEERRMIEDEQKRLKDEDKKKREEERTKIEAERNRMEEEGRRRKEEERKIEERKLKKEEDGKRRMKREEERKIEEERHKLDMEKKLENDMRMMKEEEERKKKDKSKTVEKEQRRKERDEEDYRKSEDRKQLKEVKEGFKGYDLNDGKMEHQSKTKNEEKKREEEEEKIESVEMRKMEERENVKQNEENKKEVNKETGAEIRVKEKEEKNVRIVQNKQKEVELGAKLQQEKGKEREHNSMTGPKDKIETSMSSTTWASSSAGPSYRESTISLISTKATPQQHDPDDTTSQTSTHKTVDCENQATWSVPLPVCLPEHTEQKRLSWMKECIPWSKVFLQNKRKQRGCFLSQRGTRRPADAGSLPPLCPDSLLQSSGWKSLKEVTTVTLEGLPGCTLSTLSRCIQLQSLTLRRCGLKSLEGVNQLPQLCYIDVQENDISFVDCENMPSLHVLKLGHNKLTSIHGLTGAENLDLLDLSYNSITRVAGLESTRRLQSLSLDHNQLISTKGLKDVYTLLHLNCSHNHLVRVEGLENSALLNTLDLRANSLMEPPSLNNQVLLRELQLDDNNISSLQDLTVCWLPLMQHLSVSLNRITQLPAMSDLVSVSYLDLRFNCLSELQNACESLGGCQLLRDVHLTGNPLQQESGWRSALQKAVPGLRAIDDQDTDSFPSPPAVQQVSLASGSFLEFCQAQLQQTHDLEQKHSRELSNASSALDAVKASCRHFTDALQLAQDQRFAHEYGDTTVAVGRMAAAQTPVKITDMDGTNAGKHTERPEAESPGKVSPVIPTSAKIRCSYWTVVEKSAAESRLETSDFIVAGLKTGPTVWKSNSGSVHSLATKGKITSNRLELAPGPQDLDLQNKAAVVIQQLWRKYRQKCGNISSPSTAEREEGRGGDEGMPESGPSYIKRSMVGQANAATVIQAVWRGFTLRRRLASALAAVTCTDTGEDDTFEEVDVDEFVFDEAAFEKHWTLLCEDSTPKRFAVSQPPLSFKPPLAFHEPSLHTLPPPLECRSKQARVAEEQVDSTKQRVSPVSSNRSRSPASSPAISCLTERSERIMEEWGFTHSHTALLMLKRAQKMKSKREQEKKQIDPSARLARFKTCSYQMNPAGAQSRRAKHNRNDIKVCEAESGLQQAERTERVKQERAQHAQAAHSDRDSESERFLPEIDADILNRGRAQLVCMQADPGYTERQHHANRSWANSSSAAQPSTENSYPRRNSLGHARKEAPSPKRVTSAPSKKERISFRDNPVQMSGGWGGGKKRDKVQK